MYSNTGYGQNHHPQQQYYQHQQHQYQHQHNNHQAPPPTQAPYSQQGGYSRPAQGPPGGGDPQLWQWFSSVDLDRSGSISVTELQQALVNGNWTRFDLDTVKMLMGIFDVDRSGTINFSEFAGLWKYISDWQNVFRHFDRDRSGSIEGRELAEALRSFGYQLTPNLLRLIEQKYGSEATTNFGPPPGITFDRFVRACVVVKTLTESFQRADTDRDGWVQFNYEQFMSIMLSAP